METSLFWIGFNMTCYWSTEVRALSVAQGRRHMGKLSKQFQEAGQSVCHSLTQHHI